MLIITDGEGIVATETEELKLTAGDVFIPSGVKHWLGSQPDHSVTQIALLADIK